METQTRARAGKYLVERERDRDTRVLAVLLELMAQQNVLFGDVGVHEAHLGGVVGVLYDRFD